MVLLKEMEEQLQRPVWINADVLPGPNGAHPAVEAGPFIDAVTSFFPDVTLSLGWATGWHAEKPNEGDGSKWYSPVTHGLLNTESKPHSPSASEPPGAQGMWDRLLLSDEGCRCGHKGWSSDVSWK